MSRRFLLSAAVIATILSLPHLPPPSSSVFVVERVAFAISRLFLAVPEFAAFSLLSVPGLHSPQLMFVATAGFAILMSMAIHRMAHSQDELADIVPALLMIVALFGALSVYGGGVLIAPSVECLVRPGQYPSQKLLTFTERGWAPGAHYFLLMRDPELGTWTQTAYTRLDEPENDPCASIDEIFPP